MGKARQRHSKSRTACTKVLRKVSCECVKELGRKKKKNQYGQNMEPGKENQDDMGRWAGTKTCKTGLGWKPVIKPLKGFMQKANVF